MFTGLLQSRAEPEIIIINIKLNQRFSSRENSIAPVLFKILERQFSYPENWVEHSPENSITLVLIKTGDLLLRTILHLFSSKFQSASFLILRTGVNILQKTVKRQFPSKNSNGPIFFKTVDQWFPSPVCFLENVHCGNRPTVLKRTGEGNSCSTVFEESLQFDVMCLTNKSPVSQSYGRQQSLTYQLNLSKSKN